MAQYYINVTKEELEDLDTICFKAITDGESVCIISGDRYNELLEKMNQLEYNTQEVIADKVKVVIKELQEGAYPIYYSENTGKIVNSDKTSGLTYEDILEIIEKVTDRDNGLDKVNDTLETQDTAITGIKGNITSLTSSLTSLTNTVNGVPSLIDSKISTIRTSLSDYVKSSTLTNTLSNYALKSHTHDWEKANITDLRNNDNKSSVVANLYVNKSVKLAWYTLNKRNPSYQGTQNANKLFVLGDNWAPIVPVDYRPSGIRWGSAIVTDDYKENSTENVMGMIGVGTDGKIRMIINGVRKEGHYIRGNILWKY